MADDPKQLREILEDAAPPELELAFRAMFGGLMGYAGGKPFASLSDVGLALKFAGPALAGHAALPGVEALRYEPDAPPSKSYLVVSADIRNDRARLRAWIEASVASLPPAKPKR